MFLFQKRPSNMIKCISPVCWYI